MSSINLRKINENPLLNGEPFDNENPFKTINYGNVSCIRIFSVK